MKKILTFLLISSVVSFSACEKSQNIVPGNPGEQGIKGTDGSTMHSGTGAPAVTLGVTGDYYLDKNTAELYGPKTATSWPTPISLKGSDGAPGAAGTAGAPGAPGSKILSGTSAPAVSAGTEGDFYFDTANLAFYGPKTASSWGNAVSLKASNSITTLLYTNQSFDEVKSNGSNENTYYNPSVTTYYFDATKTINLNHPSYLNAYDNGMILVRIKQSGNSEGTYWSTLIDIDLALDEKTGRYDNIYVGNDDDNYVKKGKIVLEGGQSTTEDPNGNRLKNLKFDVKVVCIPAGTFVQMSAKNIDVKDANAVAKYLNL